MIRTFLDSGVLIAAARAAGVLGTRALAVFNDADRVFVTSEFVRMEIFPKAIYYNRQPEVGFYGKLLFQCRADRVYIRGH